MKRVLKIVQFVVLSLGLAVFVVPSNTTFAAASDLEVSGWIPYWRDSEGIRDAKKHLREIDRVMPFAFTVTEKGEIRDQAGLTDREWKSFIARAQRSDVEIIPTVMWSDGLRTHEVLSSTSSRAKHINEIVKMVKKGKYDGVDIDYESKWAETINYYSLFLKELKAKLGKDRILSCTTEARTPPDSLYKVIPVPLTYANDYVEINKYCDRVVLMAYDQQRADLKLNAERVGQPYMPVADTAWVEKVVQLALKSFDPDKVVLGIPTYGYNYDVVVAPDWYRDYKRIGALNLPDILDMAKEQKVTPGRNAYGEMSFTYFANASPYRILNSLPTPDGTPKGFEAAAKALLFANATQSEVTVRLATYSDAGSIKDKIDLAKEYGLKGIALFKIDGEEDQKVWDYLEE